jgi:N utilization substance protein B
VGSRREGREYALQALYAMELNTVSRREALALFRENHPCKASARTFADTLLQGLLTHGEEIDRQIAAKSPNWSLSRMARIDLCILRLGAYELLFCSDIPRSVTINEAVEIAKTFGSAESPAFINGILDELARSLPEGSIGEER